MLRNKLFIGLLVLLFGSIGHANTCLFRLSNAQSKLEKLSKTAPHEVYSGGSFLVTKTHQGSSSEQSIWVQMQHLEVRWGRQGHGYESSPIEKFRVSAKSEKESTLYLNGEDSNQIFELNLKDPTNLFTSNSTHPDEFLSAHQVIKVLKKSGFISNDNSHFYKIATDSRSRRPQLFRISVDEDGGIQTLMLANDETMSHLDQRAENKFSTDPSRPTELRVENGQFRFFVSSSGELLPYHAILGDIRRFDSKNFNFEAKDFVRDNISWIAVGNSKKDPQVKHLGSDPDNPELRVFLQNSRAPIQDPQAVIYIVALAEKNILRNFFQIDGITYRAVIEERNQRMIEYSSNGASGARLEKENHKRVAIHEVRKEKPSTMTEPVMVIDYAVDPESWYLR